MIKLMRLYGEVLESKPNDKGFYFSKLKNKNDNKTYVVNTGKKPLEQGVVLSFEADKTQREDLVVLRPDTVVAYKNKDKVKVDMYQLKMDIGNAINTAFTLYGSDFTEDDVQNLMVMAKKVKAHLHKEFPNILKKDIDIKYAQCIKLVAEVEKGNNPTAKHLSLVVVDLVKKAFTIEDSMIKNNLG